MNTTHWVRACEDGRRLPSECSRPAHLARRAKTATAPGRTCAALRSCALHQGNAALNHASPHRSWWSRRSLANSAS